MTIQEWKKLARDMLARVDAAEDQAGVHEWTRLLGKHLTNMPTMREEMLWLLKNFFAKAHVPPNPPKGSVEALLDPRPRYNVLKFTDEQRETTLEYVRRLFDGTIALNVKTGVTTKVEGARDDEAPSTPNPQA